MSKTVSERITFKEYCADYGRLKGTNVYVSPDYIESMMKIRDIVFYSIYDNDELAGMFPLVNRKKLFVKYSTQPPLTPFFNLMLADTKKTGQKLLDFMTRVAGEYCRRVKSEFRIFVLPQYFNIEDSRPFSWAHVSIRPLYTYYIKAGSSVKADRRIKKNSKTVLVENPDFMYMFSKLKESYRGSRMPVKGDEFEILLSGLHKKGMLDVYSDDTAVCCILKDKENKVIYEFFIAGKDSGGMVLDIASMDKYKEMDFDLQGANTQSIARYKSLLNPEIRQYFAIYRNIW